MPYGLAGVSGAATFWYLLSGMPGTLVGMVGATLVLVIPVVLWMNHRRTPIAAAWSVGGLVGAYLFGVFVLTAALLLWVSIALGACTRQATTAD